MWMFITLLCLVVSCASQWDPNFAPGRAGIVHLFEWHWDTIADECEKILGPNMWAGVQISPPNENRIVEGRPWYERYQPVSYILTTRSGNRVTFQNMVQRCNAVGVKIYADVVINHMAKDVGSGKGTGGTIFDTVAQSFPGVPYSHFDFNKPNCHTSSGGIENYQDVNQVRNCRLQKLLDLNHSKTYDPSKRDCGYFGITSAQCENKGCCWAESTADGIPWCYYRA